MDNCSYLRGILSTYDPMRPFPPLQLRRIHTYSVGAMKTGTHSIADVFSRFRAMHKPDCTDLIDLILASQRGFIDREGLTRYLEKRDFVRRLEMDSSSLNIFFIEILVKRFESAKFILTVRDCKSWLDSVFNQQLNYEVDGRLRGYYDLIFGGRQLSPPKYERALYENRLHSLDGYLSYWARHNRTILDAVPRERLLVIETREIGRNLQKLAGFVGVGMDDLVMSQCHSFEAPARFSIIESIDESYLHDKICFHCKEVMEKLESFSSG